MPEETKTAFAHDDRYDPFEVPEPKFNVKMPDGEIKSFDPFDLFEKLNEQMNRPADAAAANPTADAEKVREVFGFPSKASGQPTISFYQSLQLCMKLKGYLEKLTESVKNGQGLTQK